MSDKVICTKSKITAIANKIRSKLSSQDTYTLDEMPSAIESISGGGSATIESLSITSNGTYTASGGVDGYSPITVNVPATLPDEQLEVEFDFKDNYQNNRYVYYEKISGLTVPTSRYRSVTYDESGNLIFNNTNGYLNMPYYFDFNKCFKIEIDVVGREYDSTLGKDLAKFINDTNHAFLRWDAANNYWDMEDWSGHQQQIEQPFTYFNGKTIMLLFGCVLNNGQYVRTRTAEGVTTNYTNLFTIYVKSGDTITELLTYNQSVSGDSNSNIGCMFLGNNTALKNYPISGTRIYRLNNIT